MISLEELLSFDPLAARPQVFELLLGASHPLPDALGRRLFRLLGLLLEKGVLSLGTFDRIVRSSFQLFPYTVRQMTPGEQDALREAGLNVQLFTRRRVLMAQDGSIHYVEN